MKWNKGFLFFLFLIGLWSGTIFKTKFGLNKQVSVKTDQYSLSLTAVGDLVMHLPVVNSTRLPDGSFNFRPIFSNVKPYFEAADLTVAVLESPLDAPDQGFSGYPRFNCPGAIADAIQWAGVDLVFMAHNHSLDQGFSGLNQTLRYLERIGLVYTGCRYQSSQPGYRIIEKNQIKLAFFSYTTTTNQIPLPQGKEWTVNLLDYGRIALEIAEARRAGVDGIVFALHTGTEYQREPSPEQIEIVNRLLAMGVDIILGSHVHVVQPVEIRVEQGMVPGRSRSYFVAYSLGNFLSNQSWRYSDCGLMINLKLVKDPGWPGIGITSASYYPLWVYRDREKHKIRYEIIVLDRGGTYRARFQHNAEALRRLDKVYSDTEELIGDWNRTH